MRQSCMLIASDNYYSVFCNICRGNHAIPIIEAMAPGATYTPFPSLQHRQQKVTAFVSSFSNSSCVPFLQCTATTDYTRSS